MKRSRSLIQTYEALENIYGDIIKDAKAVRAAAAKRRHGGKTNSSLTHLPLPDQTSFQFGIGRITKH
jgi:hypothetical protein